MSRENPCRHRYAGCAGAVETGASVCEPCRLEHNRREAARRARRRKKGACLKCGAPVARSKKVIIEGVLRRVIEPAAYCKGCLAYYAARDEERRARA